MQIGAESYYTSLKPQRPSLPIASSSYFHTFIRRRKVYSATSSLRPARYKKGSKYNVIEVGTS